MERESFEAFDGQQDTFGYSQAVRAGERHHLHRRGAPGRGRAGAVPAPLAADACYAWATQGRLVRGPSHAS